MVVSSALSKHSSSQVLKAYHRRPRWKRPCDAVVRQRPDDLTLVAKGSQREVKGVVQDGEVPQARPVRESTVDLVEAEIPVVHETHFVGQLMVLTSWLVQGAVNQAGFLPEIGRASCRERVLMPV